MEESTKKEYELGFLVREEAQASEVMAILKEVDAEILLEGPVKRVALAYEIQKQTSACFGFVQFNLDPAEAKALESTLNVKSEILRFLMVSPPASPAGKSENKEVSQQRTSADKGSEPKAPTSLSNEALEKKIEEILQ